MKMVNVHQAKTHLSRLLRRVSAGEEIVIAKAGRPIAKLVPFSRRRGERSLGDEKGRISVASDFDASLPLEVLSGFEGAHSD
jgi:prevent-host-death family protein